LIFGIESYGISTNNIKNAMGPLAHTFKIILSWVNQWSVMRMDHNCAERKALIVLGKSNSRPHRRPVRAERDIDEMEEDEEKAVTPEVEDSASRLTGHKRQRLGDEEHSEDSDYNDSDSAEEKPENPPKRKKLRRSERIAKKSR